jgi:hypothetical protein
MHIECCTVTSAGEFDHKPILGARRDLMIDKATKITLNRKEEF